MKLLHIIGTNGTRKSLKTLFLGIMCLLPYLVDAQSVGNYAVSRTTGITYNSIMTSGTSFAGWRYSGTLSEDDNRSIATDIGFDFWYNGQRFTQFSASVNGYIDFSSAADDGGPVCSAYGYCNSFFSSSGTGTWLALAPFYVDMTTRAGSDPLGASIKYELSGLAPNRVLTVEWDGMAVYQNTTPNLNFQVKLYETSGVIEYNYETMNSGTQTFAYTVGINAATISNTPTTSQLKTQQVANSTSFSNTPQNNLSVMPTANSQLRFTPPTPTTASGTVTITGITNTGMTVNWPNWAANEVGYVLYSSIDNVTFYFHSQTAANATSLAVTGLLPSTTYYWRVYAVTEGALSSPLLRNATTLPPGSITSIRSGRWDAANTWDCNCVPSASDNVLIQNTHNVTLRSANMQCNNLTIGQGTSGSAQFTTNTAFTLTINGNLTINNGASLTQAINSNVIHTINFRGNIVNQGTLNLVADATSQCAAVFVKSNGDQTISGSGVTTSFYTIVLNKSSKSNILDVVSSNFSCDPNALSFTSGGTFKFSSAGTNSFTLFNITRDIPSNGRIWMNSANSTMNFGAGINLIGDIRLDNGTLAVGDAANEKIVSQGGKLEINGGSMRIAGGYVPNNTVSLSNYVQTGGTLTLPTVSSTSTTQAPFSMDVAGSSFTMTGGSIILEREGGTGAQNLGFNTPGISMATVNGGTLQIGNTLTPAAQTFLINSGTSIGNLLINNANATAQLTINNLTVINNVTLTAGTLNDNGRNITFGGNWLRTGGVFTTTASSTATCNGGNQSITSGGNAFNNLTLSGTGVKSFQDNLNVNGNLTFSTSFVPVNSGFICSLGGSWTNNGSFTRNNETVVFNGTTNQTIAGSSTTDFTNITVNKSGGSVLVNSNVNLHQTLTIQSSTTFDADGTGGGIFTILSTDDEPAIDGQVATLPTGASVTGNVTVQRYTAPEIPGSTKVYRYISSPVSGQFVSDWQDDFPITGTFSNPNTQFPVGSGITSFCGLPLISSSASLFQYIESNAGTGVSDLGWQGYPSSGLSSSAPIQVGKGYATFIRECTNPTIIDVRGPINQGTISLTSLVSRTLFGNPEDGFNLIGNPYPSAIDWNTDAGWTRSGISSVIYIRDNGAGGGYITYDYTDNSPLVIATGQAFWVRVTGTPTFSINEQAKTGNAAIFYRTSVPDKLTINLSGKNVIDKAIVKINPESVSGLDDFDGPKMDNSLFDISTLSTDGLSMAVNSLSKLNCGDVLPMKIKDMTNGSYTFSFERLGAFEKLDIHLFDRYTNSSINLFSLQEYAFTISNVAASKSENRFELRFGEPQVVNRSLTITANSTVCAQSDAIITLQNSQPGIDYYVTRNGAIVSDSLIGNGRDLALFVSAKSLEKGKNKFMVVASQVCTGRVELNQPIEIIVNSSIDPLIKNQDPQCKRSSVSLTVTNAPSDSKVNWYSDVKDSQSIFSGISFNTPALSESRTYYASIVSPQGCEGNRIAANAMITTYEDATIQEQANTLTSNYTSGNQWYLNDTIIPDATKDKLIPTESGVYRLVVKVSENCTSSAERTMVVTGLEKQQVTRLSVYPNPTRDIIQISAPKASESNLSLMDSYGRLISIIPLHETGDGKSAMFDLKNLPAGMYYLQKINSENSEVVKIVKYY